MFKINFLHDEPEQGNLIDMTTGERYSIVVMMSLAVVFSTAAWVDYSKKTRAEEKAYESKLIHVPASDVIGSSTEFQGDPKSPNTLVEFGDYECPPCRQEFKVLPEVLNKFRGKVRLTFRNLPLTELHAYAMPAAEAAEAARLQGRYWPMHDALYQANLSLTTIDGLVSKQGLDRNRYINDKRTIVKRRILEDQEMADRLTLTGTPSFILCRSNGAVLRLTSLDDLGQYL